MLINFPRFIYVALLPTAFNVACTRHAGNQFCKRYGVHTTVNPRWTLGDRLSPSGHRSRQCKLTLYVLSFAEGCQTTHQSQ